jgi:hypothetical protein
MIHVHSEYRPPNVDNNPIGSNNSLRFANAPSFNHLSERIEYDRCKAQIEPRYSLPCPNRLTISTIQRLNCRDANFRDIPKLGELTEIKSQALNERSKISVLESE